MKRSSRRRKVQICMYRTYRGIIIISDYNSCNISYTIVDKYFLALLHAICYVSVCPISIKFHFMFILLCMEYWRLLHRHLLFFAHFCLPLHPFSYLLLQFDLLFHKNHCSWGEPEKKKEWRRKGKKITFINLYFVSIDRNCQIREISVPFMLIWVSLTLSYNRSSSMLHPYILSKKKKYKKIDTKYVNS